MMTPSIVIIEEFRPLLKNTLIGFARVKMPSGLVFHDVSIHRHGDSAWASPSAKPQIGRDGTHITHQSTSKTTFLLYFPKAGATLGA